MEILSIFLLLLVLGAITFFLASPYLNRPRRIKVGNKDTERSTLTMEREKILSALDDLEFDSSMGKIPSEDYPILRAELMHKGVEILRKLDALTAESPIQPMKSITPVNEIKTAREISDEDLEASLARRRANRKEKTGGFCPKCGKPILLTDVFCPSCGNALRG